MTGGGGRIHRCGRCVEASQTKCGCDGLTAGCGRNDRFGLVNIKRYSFVQSLFVDVSIETSVMVEN